MLTKNTSSICNIEDKIAELFQLVLFNLMLWIELQAQGIGSKYMLDNYT